MTTSPQEDPAFEGNSREGFGAPTPEDPTREVNWTPPRGRFGGPNRPKDIEDSYGTDWEADIEPVWEYDSSMPSTPFDEFMQQYSPDVQRLTVEARRLVLKALPEAQELVDGKSRLIAYTTGPKMADVVFVISPQKHWVNLGIYRAVELPDPTGLLEGTGKVHRHVKLNNVEDLERPGLSELLDAAVSRGQAR